MKYTFALLLLFSTGVIAQSVEYHEDQSGTTQAIGQSVEHHDASKVVVAGPPADPMIAPPDPEGAEVVEQKQLKSSLYTNRIRTAQNGCTGLHAVITGKAKVQSWYPNHRCSSAFTLPPHQGTLRGVLSPIDNYKFPRAFCGRFFVQPPAIYTRLGIWYSYRQYNISVHCHGTQIPGY